MNEQRGRDARTGGNATPGQQNAGASRNPAAPGNDPDALAPDQRPTDDPSTAPESADRKVSGNATGEAAGNP